MITNYNQSQQSYLQNQNDLAMDWIINPPESNSTARKVLLVSSDIFWILLSGVICVPPVLASLSEVNGTIAEKTLGYALTVGTGTDWFVLTIYGGVVLIHGTLSAKSKAQKILFSDDTPSWAKIAQMITSLGLGLATRTPSFTETVKFTKNRTTGIVLGLISAIGEAGLPALGQYLQLELLKKCIRGIGSKNKTEGKIETIRIHLIAITQVALNHGIKSSIEERKGRFKILYRQQADTELNQIKSGLNELLAAVNDIFLNQDFEKTDCCNEYIREGLRKTLQGGASCMCIGLFVLDALLAKTTYEIIGANEVLRDFGMVLSFAALIYIAPKMVWNATGESFDLIYDSLSGSRKDKSFGDEFYPKLSKFLKIVCTLLSVFQYNEQIALTKLYVPIDSWEGKLLSATNIIACSLMISASYYYIIDEILEKYSLSSYASKDIQNAAILKEKLSRFIALLQNTHPVEFAKILNEIEDPELKNSILKDVLSVEELTNYIREKVGEINPLMINECV